MDTSIMVSRKEQAHATGTGKGRLVLSEDDLHDFARGAAFLGTGGGGDPYIGRLMAQNAIRQYGHPEIISVDQVPDEATVAMIAMFGAPTVLIEKAVSGKDIELAVDLLSRQIGKPVDMLMPGEIGGVNSTTPIFAAARLGLPLLNADGMGRAFPSIAMVTMNFEGISATPFVIVDEHENTAVLETDTALRAEHFSRAIAIQMGLSCLVAGYVMTGAEAKTATVPDTLTIALEIGRAITAGRKQGDPTGALLRYLSDSPVYGYARELFCGKIVDMRRETTKGFTIGHCTIEGLQNTSSSMYIQFQNENLMALQDGTLKAIVPDLITIVDQETAEPIPTESLRYGQRVRVIAAAAPSAIKTPQALEHVHPRCFGLEHDFVPVEELNT